MGGDVTVAVKPKKSSYRQRLEKLVRARDALWSLMPRACPPQFNQDGFADPAIAVYNNCYAYAVNDPAGAVNPDPDYNHFPEPGINGQTSYRAFLCAPVLHEVLMRDGLIPAGRKLKTIPEKPGFYLIAAFGNGPFGDFHFIRRDANGLWSHKSGRRLPVNYKRALATQKADFIRYPKAAMHMFYQFVGYYWVPNGGISLGHNSLTNRKLVSVKQNTGRAHDCR